MPVSFLLESWISPEWLTKSGQSDYVLESDNQGIRELNRKINIVYTKNEQSPSELQ